jgi:uncharacterized lipoprotein YddW (UPF0748 family)
VNIGLRVGSGKYFTWLGILWAIGLAIVIGFPTVINAQPPVSAPATAEIRGVWLTNIDSDVLFSRRQVRRAIRRLSQLNFNTVYPTVWNWGYTLYPSSVAERTIGRSLDPAPGLAGRDMLAEVVTQGHQRGLAVIPWFEFGLMAPADSDLARRHPDWLTQRRDGSQVIMEGIHPRVWLNPFHPQVQQLMVDLITEIVTTYDVDGIQLDDHFGMPVELGYDPYTVQIYQQEHQGRRPPDNSQDPAWVRWRADQVTRLMRRVFYAVKAQKPDCMIALAPNPQTFSYQSFLADWVNWERTGLIEELVIQVYRDQLAGFSAELDRPEVRAAQTHIPVGIGILTGLRNRPIAMSQIKSQVQAVRDRRLAGVSFFFYESLGDRDADFRSLFARPAARVELN